MLVSGSGFETTLLILELDPIATTIERMIRRQRKVASPPSLDLFSLHRQASLVSVPDITPSSFLADLAFPPRFFCLIFELVYSYPPCLTDTLLKERNLFIVCRPEFHLLPNNAFHALHQFDVILCDKSDGFSRASGLSSPSDSMDVILGVRWYVKVESTDGMSRQLKVVLC